MQIKTLMRTEISPVPVDAPLDQADLLLRREGLPALPVVRGRALVGVVADTDVRWASPSSWPDLARWETPASRGRLMVADVMRVQVPTLTPETGIGEAARLMAAARLGTLPVVERDSLLGIVTLPDLIGVLVQESPACHAIAFTALVVTLVPAGDEGPALRAAVDLARRDGGRLVLLDVVSRARSVRAVGAIPGEMSAWVDGRRRQNLEVQLRQHLAGGPAPRVDRETVSGDRLAAALSAARRWEADLIVTRMPAHRGLAGLAHRRRLEALARQAPCPVLAVGGTGGP